MLQGFYFTQINAFLCCSQLTEYQNLEHCNYEDLDEEGKDSIKSIKQTIGLFQLEAEQCYFRFKVMK